VAVAIYWDFENLHAGLTDLGQEGFYGKQDNRFKVQEPLIDVAAVTSVASTFGAVAIHKAYCNWQYFGRYRDALLQNSIELVQLFPPGSATKNGADIRLCLDALEDCLQLLHINTVVVVGGDSDFMPLAQKLKALNRKVVGVGLQKATNRHWAKSCDEFRFYESLVDVSLLGSSISAGPTSG
jgi:uncharacterized LabA/DUF88 family protein